jgi:transcriptional regulator with AAA-type ATPase domain
MDYLMYVKGGVVRKFPLQQQAVVIGRGAGCDIVLDDPSVSKRHCRVEPAAGRIRIVDLKSRNGLFVDGARTGETHIEPNRRFSVGDCEFYFKQGSIREFSISRELTGMITTLSRTKRRERKGDTDTRESPTKFDLVLPLLLEKAMADDDFRSFVVDLQAILKPILPDGTVLFFRHREQLLPLFPRSDTAAPPIVPADMAEGEIVEFAPSGAERGLAFLRIRTESDDGFLLLGSPERRFLKQPALADFLAKFGEIIHLHLGIVTGVSFDPTPVPVLYEEGDLSIIGRSPGMKRLVDMAFKIADKTTFVLLMGESGTGKELFARLIHQRSGRRNCVAINCAAIPATLLESELFGHEAGSFTDARKRRIGKIEESSGGTLVLDEIGDMPPETQAKLLRVIQEKSVTRLGSNEVLPVDLRIIAMTNRDLYRRVEEGQFRQDLFFRLRVHELVVPPLRERREDIAGLVIHFARRYAARNGVQPAGFSESVSDLFAAYAWPGNVRELENEIMKIMEIVDDRELIGEQHLTPSIVAALRNAEAPAPASISFRESMERHEREELRRLLAEHLGNKSRVARTIGITYQGLLKKMKKLEME